MKCRSCGCGIMSSILDLGDHPWCNDFLSKDGIGKESFYPLHLMYCEGCELLQLSYTVPKETMFKNHTYVSGTTKTLTKHFYDLAEENKRQFGLKETDLILDIGGNDGTQALQYIKAGLKNVINVESADNIAQLSVNSGVATINDFFNEELVDREGLEGAAKLINASGVFFHLEELHSVIRGIKKALRKDGVFVVQFMYAGTMVEKMNFDMIYHEHLVYYTLKSLRNLLEPYGFTIFDAYYSEIHSGSIIAKASQSDTFSVTERCIDTMKADDKYQKTEFLEFAEAIKRRRGNLKHFLRGIKIGNPDVKIYAYGAPAKGNTLLNYFDIDNTLIDKCVEVNELKIGLYLPKTHIPIVRESEDDEPDYYLLLAHNFVDEIVDRYKGSGIGFIIPFPEIRIV